jgi:hypothetical protein
MKSHSVEHLPVRVFLCKSYSTDFDEIRYLVSSVSVVRGICLWTVSVYYNLLQFYF